MMKNIGLFLVTLVILSLFTGFATAACPLSKNTCSTVKTDCVTCKTSDCVGCCPDFSASGQGKKVSFKDKSSGTPTAYYWNFGDGYVSRVQNPVHTYRKAGTYRVCLSVKCDGKWIAKCKTVKV
jgi:PKD repeat protein